MPYFSSIRISKELLCSDGALQYFSENCLLSCMTDLVSQLKDPDFLPNLNKPPLTKYSGKFWLLNHIYYL